MLSTAVQQPASNIKVPNARDQPNDGPASEAADGEKQCARLQGLVMAQLEVCQRNPMAMPCVGLGARLGLLECRYQFQYERWNCSIAPPAVTSTRSGTNTSSVDTLIQLGQFLFRYITTGWSLIHCTIIWSRGLRRSDGNLTLSVYTNTLLSASWRVYLSNLCSRSFYDANTNIYTYRHLTYTFEYLIR